MRLRAVVDAARYCDAAGIPGAFAECGVWRGGSVLAMINTLQAGADSLTLADSNEEGANLLALQTRQQLSTTALSLASQASQAVLRLF